jgi:hypothetical protein
MKSSFQVLILFFPLFCNCQLISIPSSYPGRLASRNSTRLLYLVASEVKVKVTLQLTVSQSFSQQDMVSSPIWDSWPDIYYCLTVTVSFLWGALSDEKTGLSFSYAAGPCQCSLSRVRVPWDLWPYFALSDLRFRRLLRISGSRWRNWTPPPHGI